MRFATATHAAAWVGAGVLGVGLVTGIAEAHPWSQSSPTKQVQTAASPSPAPNNNGPNHDGRMGHRLGKHMFGRAVHGEFVVRTQNGYQTVAMQRGQVTDVSGTSITVKSPDNYSQQYTVTSET